MGQAARPASPRWPWALLAAAVVGVGAFAATRPNSLSFAALSGRDGAVAPCAGRSECVLVVMAPWCPASAASLTDLATLSERWADADVGIAVVVTADSGPALDRFAAALPYETWLDPDESLIAQADIKTLPAWFRVDPRGRVRGQQEGTWRPLTYQLARLGYAVR